MHLMRVSTVVLAALITLALAGCEQDLTSSTAQESTDLSTQCVADDIDTLETLESTPNCRHDASSCALECNLGSGSSCLGLAFAAQRDDEAKAEALFRRACELGVANACTNHAAGIWAGDQAKAGLNCATRLFEMACAAREHFACGMVGRVMLESTDPPLYAEGRRHLRTACDEVGGFSCRVLAMHLESGNLGEYRESRITELLERACQGGDGDACGNPSSATGTFDSRDAPE